MSTDRRIYWTAGDNNRTLVYQLSLDRTPFNLTGFTVTCQMVPDRNTEKAGGTVKEIISVTPDPDQATNPGICTTEFTAADLDEGVYTLEWEATNVGGDIVTFPGNASSRPVLIIRAEHDPAS
jgi:hypothetical protein